MPELAEVEYFRKQWDPGLGKKVQRVELHEASRIFRDGDSRGMRKALKGSTYLSSETRGKQIALRFTRNVWVGLHLGMSGSLRLGLPEIQPGKHDHLVLYQAKRALVFNDPRMFGRVRFDIGKDPPEWWS